MFIKKLHYGFVLSIPAGLLIFIGIEDGTEPTCWILWGIVALLGLPWNIGIVFILLSIIYGLFSFFEATQSYPNIDANMDGWLILMWIVTCAGVIGTHINGIILMSKGNKHNQSLKHGTPQSGASSDC